ncbi:condensation domain-containing protein [Streptomyces griseosporeus]|uniref:condensation domain-containing protein n=1 Tax=Streptomyces griseosporeus TaxID=1910 RepID=UPI0036FAF84E
MPTTGMPPTAMSVVKRAPLNRGQRYFWLHHHQLPADARHDTHIVLDPPLPEGLAPARVRAALNQLVRRHEGLRTTFPVGDDGLPEQVVHAPAPLPVRVIAVGADGGTVAEAVRECTQKDFDLAAEWPVRACLVTADGRARRLVLVLNHISFDDWSIAALLRELDALLTAAAAGRPAVLPPVVCQPSDLPAAAERQGDGRAGPVDDGRAGPVDDGRAGPVDDGQAGPVDDGQAGPVDERRAVAGRLPSDLFARRRTSDAPEASCSATLTSPRLLPAAREVAARHQVWPSAVHMAAFTAVTAVCTGSDRVPFWLFSSHRGSAPTMDVLTCMFDPLLTTVELPDGDPAFSAVVHATADAVRRAQERPPAAYDEMLELLAEEAGRRGHPVRVETEVNFLNYAPRSCGTRRTRFTRNPEPVAWARSGADAYFRVHEWADGVTLALRAAASVLSADAVERFLRGCEELIVAHADATSDLRLSELPRLLGLAGPGGGASAALAAVPPAPDAVPPAPGAEAALLRAVGEAGGPAAPDAAVSYVGAGGRLLRAPAVLAALHAAGWDGLSVRDLAGPLPLRALARLLVPR